MGCLCVSEKKENELDDNKMQDICKKNILNIL